MKVGLMSGQQGMKPITRKLTGERFPPNETGAIPMDNDGFETKWDEFRRKVFGWGHKPRSNQSIKVNNVRERSIGILQKRYGYTREEAIYQLDNHYAKAWLG